MDADWERPHVTWAGWFAPVEFEIWTGGLADGKGACCNGCGVQSDGEWVAIGTGSVFPETGTKSVVAVQNGEAVFEKKLDGNGVAFSPDGRRLAVGSYGAVHL